MKKSQFEIVLVLVILILTFFSLAQEEVLCASDNDCPDLTTYCNLELGFCIPIESGTPAAPTSALPSTQLVKISAPAAASPAPSSEVTNLQLQFNSLQMMLTDVQSKINNIESSDLTIQQKLIDLEGKIKSLSDKLAEIGAVRKDVGTISTGLAFLQKDLNQTSTEVNQIQSDLEKKAARTTFLTYTFVILLVIASFLLIYYYITRKDKLGELKEKKTLPENAYHYITKQIKSGRKHPEIKSKLIKAGWSEEEADWAIKETTKRNYETYLRQKGQPLQAKTVQARTVQARTETEKTETEKTITSAIKPAAAQSKPTTQSKSEAEKKKIIAISVVSIIILIAVFFILRASIGQAVYYEQKINASTSTREGSGEGAIYYEFKCTPPHLLTPTKDGCCLDNNNNQICDYIETEEQELQLEKVAEREKCFDNRQCGQGSLCMNSFCLPLYSLYEGKGDCSRLCNYYSVQVATSDGEIYTVKPGEGSYTGAGALEWKIMTASDHCKGEPAKVPINIIQKRPGKIINEYVIVLSKGQKSQPITHPYLPQLSFTLTMNQVYELCPEI